jgi:hypothetical protein
MFSGGCDLSRAECISATTFRASSASWGSAKAWACWRSSGSPSWRTPSLAMVWLGLVLELSSWCAWRC